MKKNLLIAIFAILTASFTTLYSQRPFIMNNGIYTYFIGKSEPPSNWKEISFNDSQWGYADSSAIGYGWQKRKKHLLDSVVVEKTPSLYLRIKFDALDSSIYKDLNFEADYDDAYIAYLNGEEIARKNIGKPGDVALYNTLADRAHEECTYRYYEAPVNGVYIDSSKVKRLIRQGTNIFAVHVLNDSVNGSDLSFKLNVYNLPEITYFNYAASTSKYYRQVELDSSKFPIVFIESDAYGLPYKDLQWSNAVKQVTAHMDIINCKNGISKISDPIDFSSRIKLERRGQSSRDFAKICYNVGTQDNLGNNLDTAIMGMPSGSDWVLNSNYGDKTMIRNELTLYIGRRLGHYETRTQYCELIYNGEYQGLYLFMEKIRRGKNRVNVAKRDSINPAEGGFIFKYDKDLGSGAIDLVYPKDEDVTPTEKSYITNFRNNYHAVLKNARLFLDPDSGYKHYISGKSLIDNVIINELSKNCDAYLNSTYFHKDKDSDDGRLKFGPLWDYDLAYCGANFQNGDKTSGWQFAEATSGNLHIKELFRDTTLTHEFARKWIALRKSFLADDAFFALIDSLTNNIEQSRVENYEVWPIINKQYVWPVVYTYTYDQDVNHIKDWVSKRMKWIDENVEKIYYAPLDIDSPTLEFSSTQISVYPNPFAEKITVKMVGDAGEYQINIQSLDGKIISSKKVSVNSDEILETQFTNSELNNIKNGIYFVIVSNRGQVVQAKKIIKASTIR
jgi:hypothetical protein